MSEIDDSVRDICSSLTSEISDKAKALGRNGAIDALFPVKALSQVVSGVNYFIKARVGGEDSSEHVHIRAYKKFDGSVSLAGLQVGKSADDELEFFDAEGGDEPEDGGGEDGEEIDLTGDGGVTKLILQEGTGETPPDGNEVRAHYTGTLLNGEKFDSSRDRGKEFVFQLGVGQVIKAWDVGFASMKVGERCILTCRQDYAYGEGGSPPKIPGGATLKFDCELIGFHLKKKEKWDMSGEEKADAAEKSKAEGTAAFKAKDFATALSFYTEAFDLVTDETEDSRSEALTLSCALNAGMCALKLKDYAACVKNCSSALEIDEANVKALFRRGSVRGTVRQHCRLTHVLTLNTGLLRYGRLRSCEGRPA
jgi:peptidylprolyl isomerase